MRHTLLISWVTECGARGMATALEWRDPGAGAGRRPRRLLGEIGGRKGRLLASGDGSEWCQVLGEGEAVGREMVVIPVNVRNDNVWTNLTRRWPWSSPPMPAGSSRSTVH